MMNDKALIRLLNKHTQEQEKANVLFTKIIEEMKNRGLINMQNVVNTCMNVTEPEGWKAKILELIKENKEVKDNEN